MTTSFSTQTIECVADGHLYRNPKPHVKSVDACFPSVIRMDNGEMLATITLAEAHEAVDMRTCLCRSDDEGNTWELEGRIYPGTTNRLTSDASRITYLGGSEVVVFMVRHDRSDHPEEGLTNPETLGFVPTELLILRSHDYGHTWSEPVLIDSPIEGPSFELCSPITVLSDGTWVLPTQTWPGWEGDCPNGVRMIALVSHDQGKTWPEYWDVMREPQGRVFFWETKMAEFSDGTLLTAAWKYDDIAGKDGPNQYVLSRDRGQSWTVPMSTGLQGQTMTPMVLNDDRILCVYRRMDKPGLWANLARLEGDQWINETQIPVWGTSFSSLVATDENMSENFTKLRFGAPCMTVLPDGQIFMAFWCFEDCTCVTRWYRLRIS